jgi:hypothetical protein
VTDLEGVFEYELHYAYSRALENRSGRDRVVATKKRLSKKLEDYAGYVRKEKGTGVKRYPSCSSPLVFPNSFTLSICLHTDVVIVELANDLLEYCLRSQNTDV